MKVRALILSLISSTLLVAPAYAQLGGVLGGVSHAGGSLGNTGFGVDHTLDGTLNAGRDGLNGDLASTTKAKAKTGDLDRAGKKAKKANKSAEDKTKQTVDGSTSNSQAVIADGKAQTGSNIDRAKSLPVTGDVNAASAVNASGDAQHGDTATQVNAGSKSDVSAAGVGLSASTDAHADAAAKRESESNANSGDGKLLGLDRAESRVENATAQTKLRQNETKQDEKKSESNEVRPQPRRVLEGEAHNQTSLSGKAHGPRRK